MPTTIRCTRETPVRSSACCSGRRPTTPRTTSLPRAPGAGSRPSRDRRKSTIRIFNVDKNQINSKNNRILANVGLTFTPFSWGNLKTNIGTDAYTNQNLILRHPESAAGFANNGIIDEAD